jgi:outer membrane PBP1 activator LpoA protein
MRFKALLPFLFAFAASAFSADPPPGTTSGEDIDPATGLSRSSVVRPLTGVPAVPESPPASAQPAQPSQPGRPHVALILPTASPTLGRLAETVRQGFAAAAEAAGRETYPVIATAIDNEQAALVTSCATAQGAGALLIVGGLTRDGAVLLAQSGCARVPILALNEPPPGTDLPANVFTFSLEQEARQAALLAVAEGRHTAVVIHSPSPLSRRVQEAFEREWTRAAGEVRGRLVFSGSVEDAPIVRERLAGVNADMVFLALDAPEARAVRPYVSGMLPVYATSMSINPRAEAIVNVDLQGVRYVEMPWFIQPDHPAVMIYPQPKAALSVDQERLYAFGIDAFRIGMVLLRGDRKAPLDGVTARIQLEGNHFARTLNPAEVDGGRVIPLRPQ